MCEMCSSPCHSTPGCQEWLLGAGSNQLIIKAEPRRERQKRGESNKMKQRAVRPKRRRAFRDFICLSLNASSLDFMLCVFFVFFWNMCNKRVFLSVISLSFSFWLPVQLNRIHPPPLAHIVVLFLLLNHL